MFLLFIVANMLESKSFEVELKDAEPDIIEQLVEFAYTARWVKKDYFYFREVMLVSAMAKHCCNKWLHYKFFKMKNRKDGRVWVSYAILIQGLKV